MLDEDENPVECTECIQRTCLLASALTPRRLGSCLRTRSPILVWVTRTRRKIEGWDRRVDGWRAGDREKETNWTAPGDPEEELQRASRFARYLLPTDGANHPACDLSVSCTNFLLVSLAVTNFYVLHWRRKPAV